MVMSSPKTSAEIQTWRRNGVEPLNRGVGLIPRSSNRARTTKTTSPLTILPGGHQLFHAQSPPTPRTQNCQLPHPLSAAAGEIWDRHWPNTEEEQDWLRGSWSFKKYTFVADRAELRRQTSDSLYKKTQYCPAKAWELSRCWSCSWTVELIYLVLLVSWFSILPHCCQGYWPSGLTTASEPRLVVQNTWKQLSGVFSGPDILQHQG